MLLKWFSSLFFVLNVINRSKIGVPEISRVSLTEDNEKFRRECHSDLYPEEKPEVFLLKTEKQRPGYARLGKDAQVFSKPSPWFVHNFILSHPKI